MVGLPREPEVPLAEDKARNRGLISPRLMAEGRRRGLISLVGNSIPLRSRTSPPLSTGVGVLEGVALGLRGLLAVALVAAARVRIFEV